MKHDPHDPNGVKLQAIVDAIVALAKLRGLRSDMPWREYNNIMFDVQQDVALNLPYKVREEGKGKND